MGKCVRFSFCLIVKSGLPFMLLLYSGLVFAQQPNLVDVKLRKNKRDKVKLVSWKALPCDGTYDPYRLVSRIIELEVIDAKTYITVNFVDNCCAVFKPQIQFKNDKLYLMPYDSTSIGELCGCDCCFSIQYEISGLNNDYNLYFKDKPIKQSNDYYKVVNPAYEVYNGEIINRTNKYGFQEGPWVSFYESGKVEEISKYADTVLYVEDSPLWVKQFYESGALSYFKRPDTTESWFEDGELKSQFIDYEIADTTFKYSMRKHDNRKLGTRKLEKSFRHGLIDEVSPKSNIVIREYQIVYSEEYFESGRRKYLWGNDTSYTWYESGKIELKEYSNGEKIAFDKDGLVSEKSFYWTVTGPAYWGDLHQSLYIYYRRDSTISSVEYVRDEWIKDGLAPSCRYEWKWNEAGKLIEAPKKWKEHLPWKRFPQLQVPQ